MDLPDRFWEELTARLHGPWAMRIYVQPLMAALLAFRDGAKDARSGNPPYFWSFFSESAHIGPRIRSGWKSVGKVVIVAVVLDLVYQAVVLKGFRPVETPLVATMLAIVPYVLLRGVFNRIVRSRHRAY